MNIDLIKITVRELVEGYQEDEEDKDVVGYNGKLDIRPKYQREFVYSDEQTKAVIDTVNKRFPLNVMYWAVREDGGYDMIDGQQRTISIARYVTDGFSINDQIFTNLTIDQKEHILDYELMIYICNGTDSEKLAWFEVINIAGEKLSKQEVRNAIYSGSWVSDARQYFSKNGCPAYGIGQNYVNGSPIRQDYLETVIKWISHGKIEAYMSKHQHDPDAKLLWDYYVSVIEWIESCFTKTRPKVTRGVDWGALYDSYKNSILDPVAIEKEILQLIDNDEVQKLSGICPYILTRDEKHLNLRVFSDAVKQRVYERQSGKCVICGEAFDLSDMEADHIDPWYDGGRTIVENCQILCKKCNRRKGAK